MPARKLNKSVLARTLGAKHWKIHRTPRIVTYVLGTRAICMFESMRYKYTQVVVVDPSYAHLLQTLAPVTM